MEYLIKSSSILFIFYLFYKVFLERETFFTCNRWFLLMGLIAAIVMPFLTINTYTEQAPFSLEAFYLIKETTILPSIKSTVNSVLLLQIGYCLGVFLFSIRFLIQISSLVQVISRTKTDKKGIYRYSKTPINLSPFS